MGPPLFAALRRLPQLDILMARQAFSIAIVDRFLADEEAGYAQRRFDESEGRLEFLLLESVAQMWIFGVYELLRSWRQRVGMLSDMVAESARAPRRTNRIESLRALMREDVDRARMEARKAILDCLVGRVRHEVCDLLRERAIGPIRAAKSVIDPVFHDLEALRINLAKFEMPVRSAGRPGLPVELLPNVARPDGLTGSPLWFVELGHKTVKMISRRDIAERLLAALEPLPEGHQGSPLPPGWNATSKT